MAADKARRRRPDHRIVLTALQVLGLASLWLVFSGKLDALHFVFGALSIAIVLWRTNRFVVYAGRPEEARALAGVRVVRLVAYLAWLLKEIVVANIQIARIVLQREMPIDPVLARFESPLATDLARVLLGNSITLTPGTLTVEIAGDEFLVHAINESGVTSPGIDQMQRKIARVFNEPEPAQIAYQVARSIGATQGSRR